MKKTIGFFIFFLLLNLVRAQDGYLRFEADESWDISLNGVGTVTSDSCVTLPAGKYQISARPQWNNNWPGIFLRDSLTIANAETLTYQLRRQKPYLQPPDIGYTQPLLAIRPQLLSDNKIGFSKTVKRSFLIGAIAANWASFYLKRRADSYYSNYQSSNTLSQIRNNYDQSRKFDQFSSIFLGLSVTAISAYIYMIVTD